MKKILYLLSFSILVSISSCGGDSDEPEPSHEVGTWDLDSYALQGFDAGFESNEGTLLRIDQITFGGFQVESYQITLKGDGTYARSIDVLGPDVDDNGTWELDGDDLELESDEGDFQEFDVERNEDDDLWISQRNGVSASFIPDIYFDTVTQAYIDYLDTLTQEQLDSVDAALSEVLTLDLVYIFERN